MSNHFNILFLSLFFMASLPVAHAAKDRPNFLFIVVDDQAPFDLKIDNPDSSLETPVIRQLAADGMNFGRGPSHERLGWRRLHAFSSHDHVRTNSLAYS
ncbi:MAG: hypothetical protein ACI8T1_002580 [Verrucomicrobiales bacterium]|jgi:hypothetical protein